MTRHHYTRWMMALLCGLSLTSCQLQDDLFGNKTEKEELGLLELSVLANAPASMTTETKAGNEVNTENFEVKIEGEERTDGTKMVKEFTKASELPTAIPLSVGKYTVTSNTPGKLEKKMNAPYYAGKQTIEITKDVTKEETVKCTMQNSRIQIKYSDDFKSAFKSWTITMDDGSEAAFSFTQSTTEEFIYWAFDEGVSQVRLNITATTKEGSTIRDSRTFNKSMVTEGYGDVNSDNFEGGDALILDFQPSNNPTVGNIQGVNVTVHITFSNYTEKVEIPVSDKEPEIPDTPDEPNTPSDPNESSDLTLTLPADFSMKTDLSDAPASADAVIYAKNGIKSMIVKIEPGNDDFQNALQELAEQEDPIRFLTGEELVSNTAVEALFVTLQQPLTVPQPNVTSYTFPIGNFFTFMSIFSGTHKFTIDLTDTQDKKISKTLAITLE